MVLLDHMEKQVSGPMSADDGGRSWAKRLLPSFAWVDKLIVNRMYI